MNTRTRRHTGAKRSQALLGTVRCNGEMIEVSYPVGKAFSSPAQPLSLVHGLYVYYKTEPSVHEIHPRYTSLHQLFLLLC